MPDWKSLIRARVAPLSELDAAREADIVDELAQHVAEHYAELVATGIAETEAVNRALAPLNDPARLAREIARADRPRRSAPVPPPQGGSWIGHVGRDVRYALRLLRRAPGFAAAAIVTLAVWQRLFAGGRGIVGRPVMREGRPHIVIGVMPPRFRFPMDDVELWAAIKDNMTGMPRNSRFMNVVGRLKAGATLESAQAELDATT